MVQAVVVFHGAVGARFQSADTFRILPTVAMVII